MHTVLVGVAQLPLQHKQGGFAYCARPAEAERVLPFSNLLLGVNRKVTRGLGKDDGYGDDAASAHGTRFTWYTPSTARITLPASTPALLAPKPSWTEIIMCSPELQVKKKADRR